MEKPKIEDLKRVVDTGLLKEIGRIHQEDSFVTNALIELQEFKNLFGVKLSKQSHIQAHNNTTWL